MGQSASLLTDEKFALGVAAGAVAVGALATFHCGSMCPAISSKAKTVDTGLLEYSVVYTDRATNLMSSPFQQVMRDVSATLKEVYNAQGCALIPGSGSYAMEAAARQFGSGKKVMILRNGYFSFRWTDIFNVTKVAAEEIVIKAAATESGPNPHFAPLPVAQVVAAIREQRPAVVFAPHVETATGIIFPDEYLKQVADAVHEVGGLFVLDSIASGTVWVDMGALDIDVLISAPQKGWSGPACVGIIMLGARGVAAVDAADDAGGSFCCNLKKWLTVMRKYEDGGFMYYTTLPTDAITKFRNVMMETKAHGFAKAKADLWTLGKRVRAVLEKNGFKSVSPAGFQSPGVVVSYCDDASMVGAFKGQKIQIAGGVGFMLDEPKGMNTFRIGLFGLDKIQNIDRTVAIFEQALAGIVASK